MEENNRKGEMPHKEKLIVAVTPRAANAMRSRKDITFCAEYTEDMKRSIAPGEVFTDEGYRYCLVLKVITHDGDKRSLDTVDDNGNIKKG